MARGYDVVVVGLGAMGSAATWQLARRGARVLGIDRFSPPHSLGSTHGDTRITRRAIGEGMAYVPLALRSHEIWREVEELTGADLLTTCGGLVLGRPGGTASHRGKTQFLEQTVAAAQRFGIEHEVLDSSAIAQRFPQFALAGDETGYWEPGAGFLRPEACVAANLQLAVASGADIHRDERVLGFSASSSGVSLHTTHGDHAADRLILSAGAWLPALAGDEVARHFGVYRQLMHWFATAPPLDALTADRCPIFIWEVGDARWFYGFPAIDGPDGGMKVATETYAERVDPDAVTREVTDAEALAMFDALAGPRLPHLRRRRVRSVTCLYTSTADGDFVVDWHPDSDRVLVVSPCSGHGFKHSAALGEAVAQLVIDSTSTLDLAPFSLSRFER